MATSVLTVLTIITSGLLAGVLFGVALANVPSLQTMTAQQYVFTQQLLDSRFEPTMPLLALVSTVSDVVLAVAVDGLGRSLLFAAAALLVIGVAAVSQFANVPLLAAHLRGVDPEHLPADWWDPRESWRRWHLVRTAFAVAAVAATAAATAV
nr:hypothetical protein [Actinoallomurus sp.]